MAISLIQTPQELQPAYNPMVITVDSTNKNEVGFRYIFSIYNQETTELLAELKVAPEPLSGYGYCDISKIINSNLSYDYDFSGPYKINAPNSFIKYNVEIEEEYTYSWDYIDTTFVSGSITRFQGTTGDTPAFAIGDTVQTICDDQTLFPESTGLFTIINVGVDYFDVYLSFQSSPPNSGIATFANRTKTRFSGATLSDLYAFNGSLSFKDFYSWDATDYIIPDSGASTTRMLLTDLPDNFYCTPEQDLWLNIFSDETNTNTLRVRVQNSNGDIFRTVVWNNSPDDDNITQFAIGPNNFSGETVVSGSLPLVKSDTTYYDFSIRNAANDILSKTYRVYIDTRCKIEDYEILFLDRMGSFVSYAFQLRSKETGTIERKNYNKFLGTVGNNGWSYDLSDAGQTNYFIGFDRELELTTNWMTDEMSVYFEQLLTSPITLLKDTDGQYYQVIVQDNGFETVRQKNKNLIKKAIKVRYANKQNINI